MKRRTESRRGATAVEMAFALPVFLLFLFAIFEYSRYFMVRHVMDAAAQEGCRFAVVQGSTATVAQVNAIVTTRMTPILGFLTGNTFTTDIHWIDSKAGNAIKYPYTNAPFGESVGVKVTAGFRPALPRMFFAGTTSINVTSATYMLSEGN